MAHDNGAALQQPGAPQDGLHRVESPHRHRRSTNTRSKPRPDLALDGRRTVRRRSHGSDEVCQLSEKALMFGVSTLTGSLHSGYRRPTGTGTCHFPSWAVTKARTRLNHPRKHYTNSNRRGSPCASVLRRLSPSQVILPPKVLHTARGRTR